MPIGVLNIVRHPLTINAIQDPFTVTVVRASPAATADEVEIASVQMIARAALRAIIEGLRRLVSLAGLCNVRSRKRNLNTP